MAEVRTDVIEAARRWIGTPYHHQAMVRGVGVDCLGLLRGVFIDVCGFDPEAPPAYSPSWAEVDETEPMLRAAERHLIERTGPWGPGDVLVFRLQGDRAAKHCAIATSKTTMIHAYSEIGVIETSIGGWWARHVAGVFSFPEAR
jgi:NlpC/P60 family putative phage cell wall peptidase